MGESSGKRRRAAGEAGGGCVVGPGASPAPWRGRLPGARRVLGGVVLSMYWGGGGGGEMMLGRSPSPQPRFGWGGLDPASSHRRSRRVRLS